MSIYRKPEKPKFLYYGCSQKVEILLPNQAYDRGYKQRRQNAVYATSVRDIALAFALGVVPDEDGKQDRIMDYKFSSGEAVMIFHKGHPDFGGKGYVYKLSSRGFKYAGGTQWVNPSAVTPLEVDEINVDDYLHLFRYATEEEKKRIEEDFAEID